MACAQLLWNLEGNIFLLNASSVCWFPTDDPWHIQQRLSPGLSRGSRTRPQLKSVGKAHTHSSEPLLHACSPVCLHVLQPF